MVDFLVSYCDWFANSLALSFVLLSRNRRWYAHWVGLASQPFWWILAISDQRFGILVASLFFTISYILGGIKWTKELRRTPNG